MAYTKYSLTPANNNAAPPDGAPEGMLPSAVNDTMRDMMSQIRDVGDGIRGGTYTMTAPVITGGSINNTPIGASTANTGAFTTLTASSTATLNTLASSGATLTGGTINGMAIGGSTAAAGAFTTLSATGVTTVQAGTASAPAITTTGDTNTGIFFPAADTIAFSEGGVESMRIDSSGNVGIGTSSPSARLTVNANEESIRITGSFNPSIRTATTGTSNVIMALGAVDNAFGYTGTINNFPVTFIQNNTERMRIDSSGNVGIGTSNPLTKLHLSDNGAVFIQLTDAGDGASRVGQNGTALTFGVDGENGATERMRIDSSGNLLVGTTSAGQGKLRIQSTADSYTGGGWNLLNLAGNYWNCSVSSNATNNHLYFGYNNTDKAYVNSSTGAWTTVSDKTLKKNIEDISLGLDAVNSLRPVEYLMLDDFEGSQKHLGFIAQEVQTVIPSSVSEMQGGKLGMDKSEIIPVLVKALQEAHDLIKDLQARVDALESK